MYFVYVIKHPDKHKFYVGYTCNLDRRISEHKKGLSAFTRGKQWELYMYFAFSNIQLCKDFETYLKTGSGRAFSKRRFEFQFDEASA